MTNFEFSQLGEMNKLAVLLNMNQLTISMPDTFRADISIRL